MEGPPSWNSSNPIVTGPPHSFCGIGGFLYSVTKGYAVRLLEQIFLLLSSPSREPKGQRNKHCCRERWGLQCRIHRIRNLRDTRKKKRFTDFFPLLFNPTCKSKCCREEKLGSPAIVHKRAPITVKPAGQN